MFDPTIEVRWGIVWGVGRPQAAGRGIFGGRALCTGMLGTCVCWGRGEGEKCHVDIIFCG